MSTHHFCPEKYLQNYIFTVYPYLYVVTRLQLCITYVVALHVHKNGIHICLGITVATVKAGMMQVIQKLSVKKPLEQFKITLVYTFSLSSAVYQKHAMCKTVFFEIIHDTLQIGTSVFL